MSKVRIALLLLKWSIGLSWALDICEYQMNGTRLAHPADCSKFVECQNGKTERIMSCPIGLHFNRFKNVCDLQQRAGCDVSFSHFASEEENCSACCALYGCFVNPECPETPGTTTTTESSTTSTTPALTETPTATPETTTATTENTGTPSSNATTERPSTPDTSATPDIPQSSTTPTCPDIPATTENTSTPATSSGSPPTTESASTATPATTTSPDHPTTTTIESPTTPATPNTPATSDTPATAENPTSTATTVSQGSTATTTTPTTPATPVSPNTPATTEAPATPVTPSPNGNKCSNNLTVCIDKPHGSTSHVNGTCNQYVVCVAGCAVIMPCPGNLQYNIATQRCDYPENVDCPWKPAPPITGPSGVTCANRGKCANQQDGKLFATNGSGYIVCQCECEIERPCPAGTKFREQLLTCAEEKLYDSVYANGSARSNIANVVCMNHVEICKNHTEGTLLPIDGVCNKFYKCNFGCAVEILCPNNLIYNPEKEYCDYPQNYKCPWAHSPPSGPLAGPSGVACVQGGRCTGQAEGVLFPSLTSCSKYVVCQCECEVEMDCGDNLMWDSKLLTCNYPSNVTCALA